VNENLASLIRQANNRLTAKETEKQMAVSRQDQDLRDREATKFRRGVELALSDEVLEAIGPVTFTKQLVENSMTFEQDGRRFKIQQVTDMLVQLDDVDRPNLGRKVGHQFNLKNGDTKDLFLKFLGLMLNDKGSV
jgi:hypothetical protein